MHIRLLIIQYAGDYREAVRRFSAGEDETYYAQKHSVDAVAKIASKVDEVATLCLMTESPYDEMLENGVRAIGAGFKNKISTRKIIRLIEAYKPTHLILRTPSREILSWSIRNKIKIILTLADSFSKRGIRAKFKNYQLCKLLNHSSINWVGNHGINSSMSLANIGVKAEKIIPWDWPHMVTPAAFTAKELSIRKSIWKAIYVGSVTENKGIGDLLRSVAILKAKGILIHLTVVGNGQIDDYISLGIKLNIGNNIEFLGLQPNKNIVSLMRDADLVVIPSRHEYPEGFPMTIYEALCSRTPIIASDHPMFYDKLIHHITALIFPSGDSTELARCIEELVHSSELYQSLSQNSLDAWNSLQIPVTWDKMINCWLFNSKEGEKWLFDNCLSVVKN